MRKINAIIFLMLVVGLANAFAQAQYTIDVSRQAYTVKAGYLKMGSNTSPGGETLSYNNLYLIRNGKPWFPVMGEMHFSRCAEKDWEESIMKMKAGGIQVISTYVFWNHHEGTEGVYNWSGNRNIRKFLALCEKYGMYVWLRPGPWIHAEARNGGFPDWLMEKHIRLRRDDVTYLNYANQWFNALAKQCDGFMYKQSGTIIGIQLENEMEFKKPELYQHMKTLKQLAIAAGFDVPYYSAFAQGPDDQDEFLYTMGGYPESPWATHTKKIYKPVFYIKPLEADVDIGSDLFGKVDGKVRNSYPKLGAELGSGMQKTYHRRVDVSSKDVGATAFTRIADGINGMGYFMFHGGQNPVGKTSMQESRVTNYPNDMPYINYDFQAPIGAMGIIHDNYGELRLLNTFLKDFGSELATEKPFFPGKLVNSPFCNDTVQASIRAEDNKGFIFLSNYQRHVDLPAVQNFQLHLKTGMGGQNIPQIPISFKANSYALWPYNMEMNGVTLHYATAQPFCILNKDTYVFFTDGAAEFVFNHLGVKNIKALANCRSNDTSVSINNSAEKIARFAIVGANGAKTTVIVLPRKKALQACKITKAGNDLLIISDAALMDDGSELIVENASGIPVTNLSVYPAKSVSALVAGFKLVKEMDDNGFAVYQIIPEKVLNGRATVMEDKQVYNLKSAELFKDSVLNSYATLGKKYFNPKQPGQLYQLQFHDLPGQHTYRLNFNAPSSPLIKDWIINLNYVGDVIALYRDRYLVYDQFNYDNNLSVRLSYVQKKPSDQLLAQILPLNKDYDIYVEDKMKNDKENEWIKGVLNTVTLTPIYTYKVAIK